MKKKRWLLVIIILVFLGIGGIVYQTIDLEGITGGTTGEVISLVEDSGKIEVYFCPREDCEGELVKFIEGAKESIECAFFELNLKSVQDKLREKAKEISVRVVVDNDYLKKFNNSLTKADSYGLMHNKFCVIDGKKVSTGSMNPTENCAHKNNNNLVLIESKALASNYLTEFEEMWQGKFKKGGKVLNPAISLSNITIKNYFCPEDECGERVKEELEKAKKSIDFMAFSFTHEGIANMLLLKHLENITIKGVMEARQVTEYSKFKVLEHQGIKVRKDGNKNNMHHKVFIIDKEAVVTGSFNPTAGGDERNDENVLVICNKRIAEEFLEEFGKVWEEAGS